MQSDGDTITTTTTTVLWLQYPRPVVYWSTGTCACLRAGKTSLPRFFVCFHFIYSRTVEPVRTTTSTYRRTYFIHSFIHSSLLSFNTSAAAALARPKSIHPSIHPNRINTYFIWMNEWMWWRVTDESRFFARWMNTVYLPLNWIVLGLKVTKIIIGRWKTVATSVPSPRK